MSLVGDLKYGRTVHSLVRLLSNYNITFNDSTKELNINDEIRSFLNDGKIKFNEFNSINDVIETTDVLYDTYQKERFKVENLNGL